MEYFHLIPDKGKHNDMQGPAGCWCEPEVRRIREEKSVRIVIHQGVNKDDARRELLDIVRIYSGMTWEGA